MRGPRTSAVVCMVAIGVICLYSAFTIDGVVASNAPPTVVFTLGTAHRDLTYCNSQTLDLYVPNAAVAGPLPLAKFVRAAIADPDGNEFLISNRSD